MTSSEAARERREHPARGEHGGRVASRRWMRRASTAACIVVVLSIEGSGLLAGEPDPVEWNPGAGAVSSAQRFAGSGAVQCGRGREDDAKLFACAADAFAAKTPFVAQIDRRGIDSSVGDVLAASPTGVVLRFQFDSYPSRGGTGRPSLYTSTCERPHVEETAGRRRLVCLGDVEVDVNADTRRGEAVYK